MRIAIITSCFLPVLDGVTVSGMRRLEQLSAMGKKVLLFCPDVSPLESMYPRWRDYIGEILPGVEVVTLPSIPLIGAGFDRNVSFKSHALMLNKLRSFQPDIIHVDEPERLFCGFWRRPGLEYAREAKIPCVSFFRTNFIEYFEDVFKFPRFVLRCIEFLFKKLLLYVYNSYDLTLVSSTVTHDKIKAYGIRNSLLAELHGVEITRFGPHLRKNNFFQSRFGISEVDATIKIIFAGRLTADKNWRFTFEALEKISQKDLLDKVSIIVAGDGDMRDEIEKRLSAISKRVFLLGRVSPEDIPDIMANCDIHVTTSEKETRGLTILEAFASGIPVLAPNAGGVVQNIEHGTNGLLYQAGSHRHFEELLGILIENEAIREKLGENGFISVAHLSWEKAVQNLVEIWQQEIHLKGLNIGGLRPSDNILDTNAVL